ncbi:hypothetical protein [Prescottella equi]|uniref:Uncharacterized protein n=1 Tax=Prescottella equi ATCC 33707 TaxID=525370 RepID=E9SXM3_RHOHA|nr:hypothetical protein [Prescottella equi]EGD25307.1 hypothetical protein HMPREF0724_11088 [Prescottella equi ATCC 33707]
MKVDSARLRAFASTMDGAGDAVDAIDVIGPGVRLPGSAAATACNQAVEFVEGAYLRVADRLRQMAVIARGNADEYDVTESDFTARLGAMGGVD